MALSETLWEFSSHQGKQRKDGESPRSQVVLIMFTHKPEALRGPKEATTGPELNKTLMAFDINFSRVHSPQGPVSGKFGCLLPIKAHKLCPQIPLNGISVLRACLCMCE